jgi:hypothetical protein
MPSLKPPVRQDAVVRRRTTENEMTIAALRVAASKPDGKATTTELKSEVDRYLVLTTEDRTPSKTRPNEAIYQQIIGNIVSHRGSKTNILQKAGRSTQAMASRLLMPGVSTLGPSGCKANHLTWERRRPDSHSKPTVAPEFCQTRTRPPQPRDYPSRLGYCGQKAPGTAPRRALLFDHRLRPAYGCVRGEEK